jgi:hypothetical protein
MKTIRPYIWRTRDRSARSHALEAFMKLQKGLTLSDGVERLQQPGSKQPLRRDRGAAVNGTKAWQIRFSNP